MGIVLKEICIFVLSILVIMIFYYKNQIEKLSREKREIIVKYEIVNSKLTILEEETNERKTVINEYERNDREGFEF